MSSKKPFPEAPENSTLHKVQPGEYGNLQERVQAIAKSLNIPAPDVWVADSKSLQAVAFPSNNVAITTGVLKLLSEREQDAILGHELGHRKNGDKAGLAGYLQLSLAMFSGHMPEHREALADERCVEAAYASQLYSPDDLSTALRKITAAGRTAGHDPSAMVDSLQLRANAAMMGVLPEKVQNEINAMGDSYVNALATMHLASHPSLEHRIDDINRLKQAHEKGTMKR
jgi:Zn-dependent protease with chaperone function